MHTAKTCIKVIFVCTLFLSSIATAATCYDPSPNLANQGDEYYNLEEPITLSNAEQDQIQSLFEQLRGNWNGQGTHLECLGPDSAPEERLNNVKLSLKTESNNSQHIAFNAEIKNLGNRVTRQEKIDLIGQTPIFAFESIANNHIVFSEKYRTASGVVKQNKKPLTSEKTSTASGTEKKNKKRFTRLIENVYEINLTGNNLHFIKYYYINGIYVAKDDWLLNASF